MKNYSKVTKRLPFLFTPPIIRYLERIISEFEKREQGLMERQKITPFSITLETYMDEEPFLSHYETMRKDFFDYLVERGAIIVTPLGGIDVRTYEDYIEPVQYDTYDEFLINVESSFSRKFKFEIFDIEPVLAVWKYYIRRPKTSILKSIDYLEVRRVRYKDRQLSYEDIHLKFSSLNKIKVFESLWKRRSHVYHGQETANPEDIDIDELASILKISKPLVLGVLKQLRIQLAKKEFPLKISTSQKNLLLKVNEKV